MRRETARSRHRARRHRAAPPTSPPSPRPLAASRRWTATRSGTRELPHRDPRAANRRPRSGRPRRRRSARPGPGTSAPRPRRAPRRSAGRDRDARARAGHPRRGRGGAWSSPRRGASACGCPRPSRDGRRHSPSRPRAGCCWRPIGPPLGLADRLDDVAAQSRWHPVVGITAIDRLDQAATSPGTRIGPGAKSAFADSQSKAWFRYTQAARGKATAYQSLPISAAGSGDTTSIRGPGIGRGRSG